MTDLPRHTLQHPDGRRLFVYGALQGRLDISPPPAPPTELHQRRDLLTSTWIAISPARNTRPAIGRQGSEPEAATGCPLCPGGPEVPFGYDAAVFENRFPTFVADPPQPQGELTAPSLGRCEVVLYTDAHVGSLATLAPKQVMRVVAVWRDRSADLWSQPEHTAVLVFENRGEAVGATLSHPHGQIYAFGKLPPFAAQRVRALHDHRERHGGCLTCKVVVRDDATSERLVATNASFAVTVPFAPRWPYEVHVRARRHDLRRLADLAEGEVRDLAAALAEVVARYDGLFGFELPYMMTVAEAPATDAGQAVDDWHLAVEFLPPHRSRDQLKIRASVETTMGQFINDTLPETSAAALAAIAVAPVDWAAVPAPTVVPT